MNAGRAIRTFFRRAEVEEELDAELRAHVGFETQQLIAGGMSPTEAHRRAAIALGGVQRTKEEVIDGAIPRWIEGARRDVRIAIRSLRRNRTFTITAVLALSLAIAVNTSMFSIIDGMMNPRIGAKEPDRLFELKYFGDPRRKVDFRERETAVSSVIDLHGGYTEWGNGGVGNVERGIHADGAGVIRVRPNFFTILGTDPLEGRVVPTPESATSSVVISDALRALLFHKNESPVGQTILLDGNAFTVIGVVAKFEGMEPLANDVWSFSRPGEQLLYKLVRLKDGMSLEQTSEKLKVSAAQLAFAAGDDRKDTRFDLKPVKRQFHAAQFHYALIGAGLAILLVACTNLANLQLARGLTRSTELAVRSSVGASRRQIIAQLVAESGVLAAAAMVLAVFFALIGNGLISAYVPPRVSGFAMQPQSSWRMVAAAAIATALCLVIVGLLPALRISRVDLNSVLKGRAGTGAHRANRRTYGLLVITQIGLTIPLVCAAVLLAISASHYSDIPYLIRHEIGYDPRQMVMVAYPIPHDSSKRWISLQEKSAELVTRAHAVPGVIAASVASSKSYMQAPLASETDGELRPYQSSGYGAVSPEFFEVYGLPMARGTSFRTSAPEVQPVVIDEHTAKVLWPLTNPVGHTIRLGAAPLSGPVYTVIGVMSADLTDEAKEFRDEMISPSRVGQVLRLIDASDSIPPPRFRQTISVTVRVSGDPAVAAQTLRRAFTDDPHRAASVMTMLDFHDIPQRAAVTRFIAGLFCVFAVIGLGLSVLGVYAIVSQSVIDRRREVAVRIALGATTRNILYALLREGNVLVLAGTAIGLLLVTQTSSWIGLFMNSGAVDNPFFYAGLCAALFAVMVLTALVPALRSTRMQPMDVLRAE